MADSLPMGIRLRQLLDGITSEGVRTMGIIRKTTRLAISTLALILLTGAGFGQYDRIECIGPDDQLPVFRLHSQYLTGEGYATAIVIADGYAVTAAHAVSGQPIAVSVITPEGPRAASVLARDPVNDTALLSVETTGISPLAYYRADLEPNTTLWAAGYAGETGTTLSGPLLGVSGGHLKVGAPVFPGMSGGAYITCEGGIPRVAGLITSFNYRISRRWTEITPEKKEIFERIVNDGTGNGPSGQMLGWFSDFAIKMHESNNKKREQEQE